MSVVARQSIKNTQERPDHANIVCLLRKNMLHEKRLRRLIELALLPICPAVHGEAFQIADENLITRHGQVRPRFR